MVWAVVTCMPPPFNLNGQYLEVSLGGRRRSGEDGEGKYNYSDSLPGVYFLLFFSSLAVSFNAPRRISFQV